MSKKLKQSFDTTPAKAEVDVSTIRKCEVVEYPVVEEEIIEYAAIKVPLYAGDINGYIPERINRVPDMRLTPQQGETLKRMCLALDRIGARMSDGKRLKTGVTIDALRWVIEQIGGENG